jgi:Ca-activated chloride channel family protein
MLPHATPFGRCVTLFNTAHSSIALVFAKPSGRIPESPNRAAVPGVRDDGGAVKSDLPLTGLRSPEEWTVVRPPGAWTVPRLRPGIIRVLNLSLRVLVVVCLLALQAVLPSSAQSTPDENKPKDEAKRDDSKRDDAKKDDVRKDSPGMPFKAGQLMHMDVDLALLNVTVTDPYNRLVTGLEPDNFRVFEDNIEQEVLTFSAEDVPISIGVIFDFSGSMSNKVSKAREAAVQFFKTANPQDEFFLVSFNERAELTSSFTNSVEDLQSRMMLTAPKGRTALLDALYLGLSEMRGAHNAKRALLILSDGGDNHSRYNESDIKRLVKEADTQLYAIGIYDPLGQRNRTPEELNGPSLLSEVTEMTGGRVFGVEKLEELPDIASKIGMELRNQYVLGYRPSNKAHDARWRKVKIKLRAPKGLPPLSVYSKTGYYAPSH